MIETTHMLQEVGVNRSVMYKAFAFVAREIYTLDTCMCVIFISESGLRSSWSPSVRILGFHGPRLAPSWGTEIPQATGCSKS